MQCGSGDTLPSEGETVSGELISDSEELIEEEGIIDCDGGCKYSTCLMYPALHPAVVDMDDQCPANFPL